MRSLLILIATCATALAATSCQPFTTFTARFDKQATNAPVPTSVGSVSWNSFTVERASSLNLTPKSGPNVVTAPSEAAYISQLNGDYGQYTEAFLISSFYFACASYAGGVARPVDCSVMVVAQTQDRDIEIKSFGGFDYDSTSGGMQNVTLPVVAAGNFWFYLVGGQGNAFLILDNVVIVNFNPNCPLGP